MAWKAPPGPPPSDIIDDEVTINKDEIDSYYDTERLV